MALWCSTFPSDKSFQPILKQISADRAATELAHITASHSTLDVAVHDHAGRGRRWHTPWAGADPWRGRERSGSAHLLSDRKNPALPVRGQLHPAFVPATHARRQDLVSPPGRKDGQDRGRSGSVRFHSDSMGKPPHLEVRGSARRFAWSAQHSWRNVAQIAAPATLPPRWAGTGRCMSL